MRARSEAKTVIYLDNQATTPLDPAVFATMRPYFEAGFGNPHSSTHAVGTAAAAAVERARGQIAALIGADAREIVFTSGATEANNLAILGAARFQRLRVGEAARARVVVSAIEHKCVLESGAAAAEEGGELVKAPVGRDGIVDLDALAGLIDDRTAVVSVMAVNNEMGAIQPLAAIGALCREAGALFHCDAAQAAGKIPIDVDAARIDLLSLSGHKAHGPMGIGALYIRRRPRARIEPLMRGGGQERGYRSGTLPLPLVVGFGEAAERAAAGLDAGEPDRLRALADRFWTAIRAALPDVVLNGPAGEGRSAANLNFRIPGVDALDLARGLDDVAVSTGSACSSAAVEPSYVLRAMGLSDAEAAASLRVGFGRFTTDADADAAAKRIVEAASAMRASVAAE